MSMGLNGWPAEREGERTRNALVSLQTAAIVLAHQNIDPGKEPQTAATVYHQLLARRTGLQWANRSVHVKARKSPVAWLGNTVKMVSLETMSAQEIASFFVFFSVLFFGQGSSTLPSMLNVRVKPRMYGTNKPPPPKIIWTYFLHTHTHTHTTHTHRSVMNVKTELKPLVDAAWIILPAVDL